MIYDQISNVVRRQILIGVPCVVGFLLFDLQEGWSSLLGMITVILPNWVYSVSVQLNDDPKWDVFRGFLRLAFLVANLVIVMAFFDISPLGFFLSMAIVQLGFVWGLFSK